MAVYGLDGELVAEYRQGYAPFVPGKEYGYRNGQLLITAANGDEQRLTNYVAQLYYRAGGYSTANVQTQVNTLANAGAQGEAQLRTATQTVVRQIYQASTLPAGDLVTALYLGVLQRYGDAGGISYWTSVAQSDRNGVIEAFIAPGEFDQRVQVLYGREVSDVERTDNFTKYLYTSILNRGASATEKSDRRAAVDGASAQGQSSVVTNAKDFARSLFNGAEYAARNRTNSEFVYDLYLAFLRYAPDSGGWNYWTGVVNSNGRAGVLETFLNAGAFDVAAGALYREVLWLVADHLGTPRMIAERSGQPAGIKHHDYLPFGEELFSGISGRDASHGYGSADSVRQQFTAYERDDETGLDYAQARYYSSAMGRFVSIDPDNYGAEPIEPQSWNGYGYTLNNPLKFVDMMGLKWGYRVYQEGEQKIREFVWFDGDVGEFNGNQYSEWTAGSFVVDADGTANWLNPNGNDHFEFSISSLSSEEVRGLIATQDSDGAFSQAQLNSLDRQFGEALYALPEMDRNRAIAAMAGPALAGLTGASVRGIANIARGSGSTGLNIRRDIAFSGGRSGQNVKNLTGPPNSAVRGSQGRVYVTNEKGQVILDITKDRVKPVMPSGGFGNKRPPSNQKLDLIRQVWGNK